MLSNDEIKKRLTLGKGLWKKKKKICFTNSKGVSICGKVTQTNPYDKTREGYRKKTKKEKKAKDSTPVERKIITTKPVERKIITTKPVERKIITTKPVERKIITTKPVEEENRNIDKYYNDNSLSIINIYKCPGNEKRERAGFKQFNYKIKIKSKTFNKTFWINELPSINFFIKNTKYLKTHFSIIEGVDILRMDEQNKCKNILGVINLNNNEIDRNNDMYKYIYLINNMNGTIVTKLEYNNFNKYRITKHIKKEFKKISENTTGSGLSLGGCNDCNGSCGGLLNNNYYTNDSLNYSNMMLEAMVKRDKYKEH